MKKSLLILLSLALLWSCTQDNGDEQQQDVEVEQEDTQVETDDETSSRPDFGVEVDRDAFTLNAVADFNVVSGTGADQTSNLQAALDYLREWGGGNLIIPEGEYYFGGLYMRSGVHILVSKDAVLRPYQNRSDVIVNMIEFTPTWNEDPADDFVENSSISCLEEGEQYTVDYSDWSSDIEANATDPQLAYYSDELSVAEIEAINNGVFYRARFIRVRLARDFMIADANIKSNYTKCCGLLFVGANTEDIADLWEVWRPTNGVIRNCTISNASHGYGLAQTHAGEDLLFEDLSANGGVTLRLEPHVGVNVGVENIYGYNIYNEYGKAAVLFQPHYTHHGKVVIDGVESKSSANAILIRQGFTSDSYAPEDAEIGSFSSESTVTNVKATYGLDAQIEMKDVWIYDEQEYPKIHKEKVGNDPTFYQMEGPSYAPIFDDTDGTYTVTITALTYEGFPYENQQGILTAEMLEPKSQSDMWSIGNSLEIFNRPTSE